MSSSNFWVVHNSNFSRVLEVLFEEANEKPESCSINGVRGKYRVFSDLEEALKGLKRGHTLFVEVGNKILNVNFGKKCLDISEYRRINYPGYEKALETLLMEGKIKIH
jgi:hypothetical protein